MGRPFPMRICMQRKDKHQFFGNIDLVRKHIPSTEGFRFCSWQRIHAQHLLSTKVWGWKVYYRWYFLIISNGIPDQNPRCYNESKIQVLQYCWHCKRMLCNSLPCIPLGWTTWKLDSAYVLGQALALIEHTWTVILIRLMYLLVHSENHIKPCWIDRSHKMPPESNKTIFIWSLHKKTRSYSFENKITAFDQEIERWVKNAERSQNLNEKILLFLVTLKYYSQKRKENCALIWFQCERNLWSKFQYHPSIEIWYLFDHTTMHNSSDLKGRGIGDTHLW